jgi:hypothetical protein
VDENMKSLLIFCTLLAFCAGDTPANCTYGEVQGKWTFYLDYGFGNSDIKCDPTRQSKCTLVHMSVLVDRG